MPKETGIIMSGNHPKLILEGRKTMTRRVVSASNSTVCGRCYSTKSEMWQGLDWTRVYKDHGPHMLHPYPSEYLHVHFIDPTDGDDDERVFRVRSRYEVGDNLWLRETYWDQSGDLYYKSDWGEEKPVNMVFDKGKWKSPRFMPRWASRITLEITDIRVEKLQEITEEDAVSEGMRHPEHAFRMIAGGDVEVNISPKEQFAEVWDSLNAKKHPWVSNPWCWVISFRLLDNRTGTSFK